tara:strand:+ start:4750 stop:5109 length:360 start_codon:yes stop_codon:yes gene_type:complete
MAAQGNWTIVFEDRVIIKNFAEGAHPNHGVGYIIDDDSFWSDSKFSNIWAIQYGTSTPTDEVEYRDETQHTTYADANLGDISQFSSRWDAHHLKVLQEEWDNDTRDESEKGPRPTSYSS